MSACKGMNCNSTDGTNHSVECRAEYAAAVAGGGQFVTLIQRTQILQFLDAAAGEGLVLNGIDAADLYAALFPVEYANGGRFVTVTATRACGGSEC
jgi:hypothetical protein